MKIGSYHINFKLFLWSLVLFSFSIQANELPTITANARQAYCPGDQIRIAPNFTITDPDDTGIESFFIQISSGYVASADRLVLLGSHPSLIATWSLTEGKLTFLPRGGSQILYTDLQAAVRDVHFQGTVFNTNEKFFSFNIGVANFLPSTNHFYEYVPAVGIDWESARQAAENRTYFGLRGYLATVGSEEEAQLTGSQAAGAGWIGGSDREQEGVWKWVTGPETGTVFWNGGPNGSSPNFAFWNNDEPNNLDDEDYAHVTDPSIGLPGSWNDLGISGNTSGPYQPKGYMVEYGGMPGDPDINISASTSIYLPQVTSTLDGTVCESGSVMLSAVPSEGDIVWFDALTGGNLLGTGNTFSTPVITATTNYYAGVSVNGCLSTPRVEVTAVVNERPVISSYVDAIICNPGPATISAMASAGNVYWYDSETSTIPLSVGASYDIPFVVANRTFYAEATYLGCVSSARQPVSVTINPVVPTFDILDNYTLCLDQGSVTVDALNPGSVDYQYQWQKDGQDLPETSGSIAISTPGRYTVRAFSLAGCISEMKFFIVNASEIATVSPDDFIVNDATSNNFITIRRSIFGIGSYEFALDNSSGPYSDQRKFENLSPGRHIVYIRDTRGCGITQFEFIVLDYPEFFTPNGDGVNDVWSMRGYDRNFYTTSDIFIFDRFGRLVAKVDPNSAGWDGNYNGRPLPSSDYWFRTKLTDINGSTIERKGHFSLLRK